MKAKKQDGTGRNVPTNHTKIKPEESLKKLVRKYIALATKKFEQQADK